MAGIGIIEKIVFNSGHFAAMLAPSSAADGRRRHEGRPHAALALPPMEFLGRPGLWIGLAFAAAASPARCTCDATADPI